MKELFFNLILSQMGTKNSFILESLHSIYYFFILALIKKGNNLSLTWYSSLSIVHGVGVIKLVS